MSMVLLVLLLTNSSLIEAASYDITVTLTAICNLSVDGGDFAALEVTEPTGEACSYWNDTTVIGGWMSISSDYERYHLANAMDGYYYIKVQADSNLVGVKSVTAQVTVLLYEGSSKETIINYGPFMFYDEWTKVGCFKMPEGVEVAWGDTAEADTDSGCFIATAAYGTEMANEVRILSKFRNQYLTKSSTGESLVKMYYKVSPPIAKIIANNEFMKVIVRLQLKPWVRLAQILIGDRR